MCWWLHGVGAPGEEEQEDEKDEGEETDGDNEVSALAHKST